MYNPSKPYKNNIQTLIRQTWDNPYIKVRQGIYPTLRKKFSDLEVDHTDGIGTKGFYHWQKRTFKEAVIDALAMNLNDLALMQAVPYKIQNHLTLPEDDHEAILEIIKCLAQECKKRQIAITGGETSIHDNSNSLEISISMAGMIKKQTMNQLEPGCLLVGLPSNGLHSNGFSLVRKIFKDEFRDDFTNPTVIYLDQILELAKKVDIKGMMHITGGAFTKLKDLLVQADAVITKPLKPQPVFEELFARGVDDNQMYKTFNCGIGFVVAVAPKDLEPTKRITQGTAIGEVVKGKGKVKITSAFSDQSVEY